MCLHLALQQCPPQKQHLELMGERLGHIRLFMMDLCKHGQNKDTSTTTTMAPSSTTTHTTLPTTESTKTTTPTTYSEETDTSGDFADNDIESQYIVLHTTKNHKTPVKLENEVLEKDNSQDASLNAAFKTLEIRAQHKRCTGGMCNVHNSAVSTKLNVFFLACIIFLHLLFAFKL